MSEEKDWPAKVTPRLFSIGVLPTGLKPDEYDRDPPSYLATVSPLSFYWYTDGALRIESLVRGSAEDAAREALSALLFLIPAEQVVQAMGEGTKDSIRMALLQEEEQEIAELKENRNAWHQRAIQAEASYRQALARAEKAEADWDSLLARASKAEMERDVAIGERNEAIGRADASEILRQGDKEETESLAEDLVAMSKLRGRAIREREQAERERDEARSELDRCKAFCRERIQEIHQWERWADLSPRGINVDAPPSNAMHAAAEELRAQGAELGENLAVKDLVQYPGCTGVGRVLSVRTRSGEGATEYQEVLVQWPDSAGEYVKPVWDRSARLTRLPADLCLTGDGRSVRTMATNEVRDVVTGKGLGMTIEPFRSSRPSSAIIGERFSWVQGSEALGHETHPCSLPSNRLRVEAFLKDSEVPDPSGPSSHQTGTHDAACAVQENTTAAVLPEAHSGRTSRRPYVTTHDDETLLEWWNGDRKLSVYIDDGGIRALKVGPGAEIVDVELALGGWAAARDWLNGTGRKTEESDAQGMAVDGQAAQPKAPAASVHEGFRCGMKNEDTAKHAFARLLDPVKAS